MSQNKVPASSRFLRMLNINVGDEVEEEELTSEEGVEYDPDDIEEIVIETFDEENYYFTADAMEGYSNKHNLALQLDHRKKPRLEGLVETCRAEREQANVVFEQGMWVEYRSNDMEWKVGLVNRVVKQAPDSWDYSRDGEPSPEDYLIYYNVGVEGLLEKESIRAPTKGLQFIFGKRPWLWQQFTLLQLEKRIRFDESHEYDFAEIDCYEFASDRFDAWLDASKNEDFKKLYESQPLITQQLLKQNLLTPFKLCDEVIENEDAWDFDDPDISVYTYLAVFGSGFSMSFITLIIQIISPLILAYNAAFLVDGEANPRFELDPTSPADDPTSLSGNFLPDTSIEEFCRNEENRNPRAEGKMLITVVLLVYICTVIPDSLLNFFRVSGGASSTFSKISSLRQIIWYQNDDDILQQLGFKIDRLMNTGYISLLYSLMLFILIQTPIVLDIILNALAIEFIHDIDERIANSDWWDEGNRWIAAGTIELIIQSTLRLRVLDSPRAVCRNFDIDYEDYCAALGGPRSLNQISLARADDNDPKYMSKKERTYAAVANKAQNAGNDFAYEEYHKHIVQFGIIDVVMAKLGLREKGVFNRYPEYRTWSRWERILFLPKLATPDTQQSSARLHRKMGLKVKVGASDFKEFITHVFSVLSGYELLRTTVYAMVNGHYFQVPMKIFLGLLEWLMYVVQISFPLLIIPALVIVPLCY